MGSCQTESDKVGQPLRQPQQQLKPLKAVRKPSPYRFDPPDSQEDKSSMYSNSTGLVTDFVSDNGFSVVDTADPKGLFVDEAFPMVKAEMEQLLKVSPVELYRAGSVPKYNVLFRGELQPQLLKPGRLDNWSLLCALACFQARPSSITRLLQQKAINQHGWYGIWLFVNGRWEKVVVDDMLPFHYNQCPLPQYNHQLWIMMLSKAYAKLHNSYHTTHGCGEMLTMLTGAPHHYHKSSEGTWEVVRESIMQGQIVLCTGQQSEPSYPIVDAEQIHSTAANKEKKLECVVKLWNGWGRFEWKGRWSEYSDAWSEDLRQEFDYQKADDSVMWMTVQDMLQHIGQMCVCMYQPKYVNTTIPINQKQHLSGIYVQVHQNMEGYMSVVQACGEYSRVTFTVVKLDRQTNKMEEYIGETTSQQQYASLKVKLKSGCYFVLVEASEEELRLNMYGSGTVTMVEEKKGLCLEDMYHELMMLMVVEGINVDVMKYEDSGIKKNIVRVGSYLYVLYENKSEMGNYLHERVDLKKAKNVAGVDVPDPIYIQPKTDVLIRFRITSEGDYSLPKECFVHSLQQKYSNEQLLNLIQTCQNTSKKQREIEGKKINVWVKVLKHKNGVALYYENKMEMDVYVEEIQFITKNLIFDGSGLRENRCEFQLQPKKSKMFSFVLINPQQPYEFRTKIAYYITTPEFKF